MFNPSHEKVLCRGNHGIYTRAATGLCAQCRDRLARLWYDMQLANEVAEFEKLNIGDLSDEV